MAAMAGIRELGGDVASVVSLNDDNQRFRDRHGAVAPLTSNRGPTLARATIRGVWMCLYGSCWRSSSLDERSHVYRP